MERFNISNGDLGKALSHSGERKISCNVLFPDGTIIENAKVCRVNTDLLLVITIHGVEFQDWVGFGSRLEDLKYEILKEKP